MKAAIPKRLVAYGSSLFVIFAFSLAAAANAQIYKSVDPNTGEVQYHNAPRPGAERVTFEWQDSLSPAEKRQIEASQKQRDLARKARSAKESEAKKTLAKNFASCTEKLCEPEPGMPIDVAVTAFSLGRDGFSHTKEGKRTNYKWGKCHVYAERNAIVEVRC